MVTEQERQDWDTQVGGQERPSPPRPRHPATRASRALTRRPAQRGGRTPAPQFASCEGWVNGWLLPVWTRSLGGNDVTWCPQWWRHPEAVARLTALWLSWEQLRMEPGTGMSAWWRDHADHHLPVLLAERNVFKGCSPAGHTYYPLEPLPSWLAPPGTFDP